MALIRLNNQSLSSVTALPSGITTGSVLQVQSTLVDTTSTVSLSAYTGGTHTYNDITGVSVNITPSSNSSKILLLARLTFEFSSNAHFNSLFTIRRGSNYVGIPASSEFGSNRPAGTMPPYTTLEDPIDSYSSLDAVNWFSLDAPNTTSAITYQVCRIGVAATTMYLNRTVGNVDDTSYEIGTSEIVAIEIAG